MLSNIYVRAYIQATPLFPLVPQQGHAQAYNSNALDKVELKAQVVFDTCWRTLESKLKQV